MKNYETRKDEKGNTEVKDIEGVWRNANNYNESLETWPTFAQKFMTVGGEPCLTNVTTAHIECGCKIVGCGTLQFPLTIDFCERHDTF